MKNLIYQDVYIIMLLAVEYLEPLSLFTIYLEPPPWYVGHKRRTKEEPNQPASHKLGQQSPLAQTVLYIRYLVDK